MRSLIATCLVLLLHPALAGAETQVSMGSISADGLELQNLSCALQSGGLFGGIAVVGAVAKQKRALDACAPGGASFTVAFDFREGRTRASVSAGGKPAERACIQRALSLVRATLEGRCTAVLLAGDSAAAKKSAVPAAPERSTSETTVVPERGDPQQPAHPVREAEHEPVARDTSARAQSPLASTPIARLRALIGTSPTAKASVALLGPLAADRKLSSFSDCSYQGFARHGLSIRIANDLITTVFLYAQNADEFDAYPGALPGDLKWTDVRRDVEKKLGAATKTGGDGVIAFWAEHPGGISVTYRGKSTSDLDNPLHHIVLSNK